MWNPNAIITRLPRILPKFQVSNKYGIEGKVVDKTNTCVWLAACIAVNRIDYEKSVAMWTQ